MDRLPDPPYDPNSVPDGPEGAPEKRGMRGVLAVILVVAVLGGLAAASFLWLRPGEVAAPEGPRSAASPSVVAPAPRVNPCSVEDFDANGCAVRMIQGAAAANNVPPYTVVQVWCAEWDTKKRQNEEIEKWISQGAKRYQAVAVMKEMRAYCKTIAPATGP